MKKIVISISFLFVVVSILGYLILFEGKFEKFSHWWADFSRHSSTLPFCPYKIRHEDSAFIRIEDSNRFRIEDRHIFWKGSGCVLVPEINSKGILKGIFVQNGGTGYSGQIKAYVEGANSENFDLGEVTTNRGSVINVAINRSYKWSQTPLVYYKNETLPYSGTIEKKFPSGQVIVESQYLSGQLHGKVNRFNEQGIPTSSKEYTKGKKMGTHIFWYPKPIDPENFVPIVSESGKSEPTLWLQLRQQAREKFGKEYNTNKSNKWVVSNYKLKGGSFQVKLLEHWLDNQKHGLFEGFDEFGNKTFKDDYSHGKRIKHKIFDKTK